MKDTSPIYIIVAATVALLAFGIGLFALQATHASYDLSICRVAGHAYHLGIDYGYFYVLDEIGDRGWKYSMPLWLLVSS